MPPKNNKAKRREEKVSKNKTRNEVIRANKKTRDETLHWLDCVVSSVLITSEKTIIDVQSDSGVDILTFGRPIHLRKGDLLKALVFIGREVKVKPEFDEVNGIWKRPPDEAYLVERSFNQVEDAIEIKVLEEDGVILCHYGE